MAGDARPPGDPDAGYGDRQPSGWYYNILAYTEEARFAIWGKTETRLKSPPCR